jgi:hypothetical protein
MVNAEELRDLVDGRQEWLLVREAGPAFPLYKHEIEIDDDGEKTYFGFLDDRGFHTWRLNGFVHGDGEITIDVAGAFAKRREIVRLVPRTLASELAAEVEKARLEKANDIAALIATFSGVRLGRVALNEENGRFAQVIFDTAEKVPIAAMADVTGSLTVESIFTAAMLWIEKLGLRKKRPINDIWVICEKRQAKNAQKLHALLSERWKSKIMVFEIIRRDDPTRLVALPKRNIRELWRERAPNLILPARPEISETARRIIACSPGKIDVVLSRKGETLRFMGLPFARVRSIMGVERAWFGIGRDRRILTDEMGADVDRLILGLN